MGSKTGVLQQAAWPSQTTGMGTAVFVVYHKVSQVGKILRKSLVQTLTKAVSALRSDQVAQDFIRLGPGKNLQGWRLHGLSGQCMTVLIMEKFLILLG